MRRNIPQWQSNNNQPMMGDYANNNNDRQNNNNNSNPMMMMMMMGNPKNKNNNNNNKRPLADTTNALKTTTAAPTIKQEHREEAQGVKQKKTASTKNVGGRPRIEERFSLDYGCSLGLAKFITLEKYKSRFMPDFAAAIEKTNGRAQKALDEDDYDWFRRNPLKFPKRNTSASKKSKKNNDSSSSDQSDDDDENESSLPSSFSDDGSSSSSEEGVGLMEVLRHGQTNRNMKKQQKNAVAAGDRIRNREGDFVYLPIKTISSKSLMIEAGPFEPHPKKEGMSVARAFFKGYIMTPTKLLSMAIKNANNGKKETKQQSVRRGKKKRESKSAQSSRRRVASESESEEEEEEDHTSNQKASMMLDYDDDE